MWANLKPMGHDDEALYDLSKNMPPDYEPPEYPSGLQFSLLQEDVEKAGIDPMPGDSGRFSAMGEVTSVFVGKGDARIELKLTQFGGEDGKLTDLAQSPHICLCGPELEKMGLDTDCERGDTIHLLGNACIESVSSTEYGGDMVCFQITDLAFEDESKEARGG